MITKKDLEQLIGDLPPVKQYQGRLCKLMLDNKQIVFEKQILNGQTNWVLIL